MLVSSSKPKIFNISKSTFLKTFISNHLTSVSLSLSPSLNTHIEPPSKSRSVNPQKTPTKSPQPSKSPKPSPRPSPRPSLPSQNLLSQFHSDLKNSNQPDSLTTQVLISKIHTLVTKDFKENVENSAKNFQKSILSLVSFWDI